MTRTKSQKSPTYDSRSTLAPPFLDEDPDINLVQQASNEDEEETRANKLPREVWQRLPHRRQNVDKR